MNGFIEHDSALATARFRRVRRPWRIAFVMYAVALIIATHWPSLTLGPEMPGSDKTIHLAAFGLLTMLLWRTGWLARLWLVCVIVGIWGVIDEFSQGLPGLNRTVTPFDTVANALGVMTATAWIWALGPVGMRDGCNRLRLRIVSHVIDELFARWRPWIAAAAIAVFWAVVLLIARKFTEADGRRHAAAIAIALCCASTVATWFVQWQREMRRQAAVRPCIRCGSTRQTASRCPDCGSAISRECWTVPVGPGRKAWMRMGARPMLMGVMTLAIVFGFIALTPIVYAAMLGSATGRGSLGGSLAPRVAHFIGTLPREFTNIIDLACLLLVLAALTRVYRRQMARFFDQAQQCVGCGHDVRYTPVDEHGVGRCGECGTTFVRSGSIRPR